MSLKENVSKKNFAHSAKSVLLDVKQYLSFFLALLIVQTLFFTLLTTTETNNKNASNLLSKQYKYHIYLTGLSENDYTHLQNQNTIFKMTSELWPTIDFLGHDVGTFSGKSGKVGIIFDNDNPAASESLFFSRMRTDIKIRNYTRTETPLYTDNPAIRSSESNVFTIFFWVLAVVTVIFGILASKVKYPIRDDGTGERIYRSTSAENFRVTVHKVFFTLMVLSGAACITFLLLRISFGNGAAYFLLYMFLLLLSVAFMTALFNVRVNHYKFRYGIYMAFGAGFTKLYTSAVLEMLVISLVTLIPSVLISLGISSALFAPVGIAISFNVSSVFLLLIVNCVIVFASTYMPMKAMAIKAPVTLLYAQDNSNLVSSPRRSAKIFRKSFPSVYEALGMWRFRKYFVKLTVIAVSFTTVFLCGLYIADTLNASSKQQLPEFVANAQEGAYLSDEEMLNLIDGFSDDEVLDYIFWTDSKSASSITHHALINQRDVINDAYTYNIKGNGSHRYKWLNAGYNHTTDNFVLFAYNEALIKTIVDNSLYEIEGDPYSVLKNDRTIIVSEYISDRKYFDFSVGDKIVLAVPTFIDSAGSDSGLGGGNRKIYLEEIISKSDFSYVEYTVGAIINHSGSSGAFMFGLNADSYSSVTGDTSVMKELSVFAKSDASPEEIERLHTSLNREFELYNYSVSRTYNNTKSQLYAEGRHHAVIITVSSLIMMISPLIWFFSQLQFFRRREKEMFVLTSIGTPKRKIRALYFISGIILAILSAVMTLAMSYIADYLIYLICTQLISSMTPIGDVVVTFYMPTFALVMCLAAAVICGFLSSVLPFALRRLLLTKAERYTSDGM